MASVHDITSIRKHYGNQSGRKKSSPTKAIRAPAKSPARAKRQKDACDLLDADHKAVKAIFKEYETLFPKVRKTKLDRVNPGEQLEQRKQVLMAEQETGSKSAIQA